METLALRIPLKIVAFSVSLASNLPVLAQESRCAIDPHDSSCALDSTLHLLRLTAIILAVILVLTVVLVVFIYRKNQRAKLTPHD